MEDVQKIEEKTEDNISEMNNSFQINTKLKITFSLKKIENNCNLTLYGLKKYINTHFLIEDKDYKLFIGDISINDLPNNTLIKSLIDKYKINVIDIKTYKSIFDIQKQLNIYEKFLEKKIIQKEDEIQKLKNETSSLYNDLKEFNL